MINTLISHHIHVFCVYISIFGPFRQSHMRHQQWLRPYILVVNPWMLVHSYDIHTSGGEVSLTSSYLDDYVLIPFPSTSGDVPIPSGYFFGYGFVLVMSVFKTFINDPHFFSYIFYIPFWLTIFNALSFVYWTFIRYLQFHVQIIVSAYSKWW